MSKQWFCTRSYRVTKPSGNPAPWVITMALNLFVALGVWVYILLAAD